MVSATAAEAEGCALTVGPILSTNSPAGAALANNMKEAKLPIHAMSKADLSRS